MVLYVVEWLYFYGMLVFGKNCESGYCWWVCWWFELYVCDSVLVVN